MTKFEVYNNPAMGDTPYHVARKIREDEPLHSGNIIEVGGYFADKEAAQIFANVMNEQEERDRS